MPDTRKNLDAAEHSQVEQERDTRQRIHKKAWKSWEWTEYYRSHWENQTAKRLEWHAGSERVRSRATTHKETNCNVSQWLFTFCMYVVTGLFVFYLNICWGNVHYLSVLQDKRFHESDGIIVITIFFMDERFCAFVLLLCFCFCFLFWLPSIYFVFYWYIRL